MGRVPVDLSLFLPEIYLWSFMWIQTHFNQDIDIWNNIGLTRFSNVKYQYLQ